MLLRLIEEEILEKAPIGSRHAGMVNTLTQMFSEVLGKRCVVAAQNPIALGRRSMPQPDLALLAPRADNYALSHPVASDVLLLIEVADTTRAFDLGTKVPLYASQGIAEVWVVDLIERTVRVFRNPGSEDYREQVAARVADHVRPQAFPEISMPVASLFPD